MRMKLILLEMLSALWVFSIATSQAEEAGSASTGSAAEVGLERKSIIQSRQFSFTNEDFVPASKESVFCLPKDQQLLKVDTVKTDSANANATVNVVGMYEQNCLKFSVMLPSRQQSCFDIPSRDVFRPWAKRRECIQAKPSEISMTVEYETKPTNNSSIFDDIPKYTTEEIGVKSGSKASSSGDSVVRAPR